MNTNCFTIFVHWNFRRKIHSDWEYHIVPRPRKSKLDYQKIVVRVGINYVMTVVMYITTCITIPKIWFRNCDNKPSLRGECSKVILTRK